jgi:hypothetical protein
VPWHADSFADLGGVCIPGDIPVLDPVSGTWVCGVDIDTDTQLTDAEVAAAATAEGFVTGPHTIDTDTQLNEAQVDTYVANNNYSTGAHTTDTNTQLTEGQVDAFVANNNYSTGAHTTDTDTQLTEGQVDAFVANNNYSTGAHTTETDPVYGSSAASGISSGNIGNWNTAYGWGDHSTEGYLTPETAVTTIESKPFLLRSAAAPTWASGTQWVTVASLTPLTSGNHLTPTSITVSGYITNTRSTCATSCTTPTAPATTRRATWRRPIAGRRLPRTTFRSMPECEAR